MLNAIIVASERRLVSYLTQVCAEFPDIFISKTLDFTAGGYVLAQALNSHTPDVLFLDVSNPESWEFAGALSALGDLLLLHPQTAVVPIASVADEGRGIRVAGEELGAPLAPRFSAEDLEQAVLAGMQKKRRLARSCVVAVLPAKPGAGATTAILNIAGCLANNLSSRTLLIEADWNSGPIPLMLDLFSTQFIASSIEDPQMLTDAGWEQVVTRRHGIDILAASGTSQSARGSRWDYYRLLKFARERYEFVLIDLPEVIDEVAEAVIAEADKVYMVCTPDEPSMKMVGRRLWDLQTAGVRQTHVKVLVNRRTADDPPPEALAGALQREVAAVLPEDRAGVRGALRRHALLDPGCELGRSLLSLAEELRGVKTSATSSWDRPNGLSREATSLFGLRRLVNVAFGRK
jgi:pilus assembly protein CpaE